MNDIVRYEDMPLALMPREEAIAVLCNSLYPGASPESALLVLQYCKASNLDPMLKPVHIVPMSVKTGKANQYGDDQYETRDVIMPGIGLYRVNAARTMQYAGIDEPAFGPMVTMTYKKKVTEWIKEPGAQKAKPKDKYEDAKLEYPEWCRITIYRIVQGVRCAFTAVEYWDENYATVARNSDAPNTMWARRTRGQIAKCTEAQALRKGFPEVGQQPTFEEMEGRTIELRDIIDGELASDSPSLKQPQSKSERQQATQTTDATAATNAGEQAPANDAANTTTAKRPETAAVKATPGALKTITLKADAAGVTTEQLLVHFSLKELEGIDMIKVNEILAWIKTQAQAAA